MVELSTPIKSWISKEYDCNRRVAGSIPVRLNLFLHFFFYRKHVHYDIHPLIMFFFSKIFPLFDFFGKVEQVRIETN